jgi:predicted O-methyltransferase YrrM
MPIDLSLHQEFVMSDNPTDLIERIDDYIENLFSRNDAALQAALEDSARYELPAINVSANEGRLLYMLAKISGARRILEIGTLGGYSTIWLARALPEDGRLLSLEYSPKHAEVASANIARAGLAGKVEVRVGAGLDLLPQIADRGEGPFDLFFIDADKVSYPGYLDWAIRLSRPGSVILSDNLIRDGLVLNPPSDDENAVAIAVFNREIASNPRLESHIVPIWRRGTDGLGISVVRE